MPPDEILSGAPDGDEAGHRPFTAEVLLTNFKRALIKGATVSFSSISSSIAITQGKDDD